MDLFRRKNVLPIRRNILETKSISETKNIKKTQTLKLSSKQENISICKGI